MAKTWIKWWLNDPMGICKLYSLISCICIKNSNATGKTKWESHKTTKTNCRIKEKNAYLIKSSIIKQK